MALTLQQAQTALDAWIDAQPDPKPSRPEGVRWHLKLSLEATRET